MFDVIAIYEQPDDEAAFDGHYRDVHAPLVRALPGLQEFAWGKVASDGPAAPYMLARMTYLSAEDAEASMAGPEGRTAVDDLGNFAQAGVRIVNVGGITTWP